MQAAAAISVENFGLSEGVKKLLRAKGIESLFPIQAACLPPAMAGKDVSGRALTGSGKTYAFVLPVVEMLMREKLRPVPGNASVICLLPTRELAKQARFLTTELFLLFSCAARPFILFHYYVWTTSCSAT